METDDIVEKVKNKFVWKWKYTVVLMLNVVYIIAFYYLMKNFS